MGSLRPLLWALCFEAATLSVPSGLDAAEAGGARLSFEKIFPGSTPEYVRVTVDESGAATYEGHPLNEQKEPASFHLSAQTTAQLFRMAAELNYLRTLTLESGLRVARMGEKTFVYERAGERNQVSYNYTRNATATALQQLFERIAVGRNLVEQLEYRLLFDRLGVMEVLRELEKALNQGVVVDPEQFVPTLEKIRDHRGLFRMAQARAQELLGRIRQVGGWLQVEYGDARRGWYYKLILSQDGAASYERRTTRQPAESKPLPVPARKRQRLFELAALIGPSAGGLQNPGEGLTGYRLTYDDGRGRNLQLVFAQPPSAVLAEMVHITRQLLQQEHFRNRLRTAPEQDPLLLQVTLQEFEAALDADELADPKEFLPFLQQLVEGETYHPSERESARRLQEKIRAVGGSSAGRFSLLVRGLAA